MKNEEFVVRKTLDYLLEHTGPKDLNLISIAIQDYEDEGYDLNFYRKKVEELRRKYPNNHTIIREVKRTDG